MLRFNKYIHVFILITICASWAMPSLAQTCQIHLRGKVADTHTSEHMRFVAVYEPEQELAAITDELGYFEFHNMCPGHYHFEFSHLGCSPVSVFLELKADTLIEVQLLHNAELLKGVEVNEDYQQGAHLGAGKLDRDQIESRADLDLAPMLEQITGLQSIKNGSNSAKPVYHGLSSNRLGILQDGVSLAGQQWGADHAPEIDPFQSDRLRIIQGVNTLAFDGPELGGMISIESAPIGNDPHLHGKVLYGYSTNGRGHSANARMQKAGDWAAWRMSLTAKDYGDKHSPEYFLKNTGNAQLNADLTVQRDWHKRFASTLHLSSFNTEIGILRGSHIGNLTDLREALERDVPFYTEDDFSREIGSPRQTVGHHRLRLANRYNMRSAWLDVNYAFQFNQRKEFDVRRGGRTETPAMDIDRSDHFLEAVIRLRADSALSYKAGLQTRHAENRNDLNTGILPLIPDYYSQSYSAFFIAYWNQKRFDLSAGARYKIKNIYALAISNRVPREIQRHDLWYSNPSGTLSARYKATEELDFEAELSYRERMPEVNELFANGLHQGVSGVEEGDINLKSERGTLARLTGSWHVKERVFIDLTAYGHQLDDYIYLLPQDQLALTIRGAFPFFKYEQVDAQMRGLDVNVGSELTEHWRARIGYSHLRAWERESMLPLIGVPSDRARLTLMYETSSLASFHDVTASIGYQYQAKRDDLIVTNDDYPDRAEDSPLQGQDFVPPPDAYGLVDIALSAKRRIGAKTMNCSLQVSNLLDEVYRDYMDRQRYFADAMGRNVTLRLGLEF